MLPGATPAQDRLLVRPGAAGATVALAGLPFDPDTPAALGLGAGAVVPEGTYVEGVFSGLHEPFVAFPGSALAVSFGGAARTVPFAGASATLSEAGQSRLAVELAELAGRVYSGAWIVDWTTKLEAAVAAGQLRPGPLLEADQVLAKHDENYTPPEVAEGMKAGHAARAAREAAAEAEAATGEEAASQPNPASQPNATGDAAP